MISLLVFRFAEAGDDDEDGGEGDETIERVIDRLREVNHSYLQKSKQVTTLLKDYDTFVYSGKSERSKGPFINAPIC